MPANVSTCFSAGRQIGYLSTTNDTITLALYVRSDRENRDPDPKMVNTSEKRADTKPNNSRFTIRCCSFASGEDLPALHI